MKTSFLWCSNAVVCVAAHLLAAVQCAQENENCDITVTADGVDYKCVVDEDSIRNVIEDKAYVIEKLRHTSFGPGSGVMELFFFSRHGCTCRHAETSSKIKSDPDVEKKIHRILEAEDDIDNPFAMFALMRFRNPASSLSFSVGKYAGDDYSGVDVDGGDSNSDAADDVSESKADRRDSCSDDDNDVSESDVASGAPCSDAVVMIKKPYHAIDIEENGGLIQGGYCCVKGHDLKDIDFCYGDCDCELKEMCVLPGPFVVNH